METSLEKTLKQSAEIAQRLAAETTGNSAILSGLQDKLNERAAQIEAQNRNLFEKAAADIAEKEPA